jgi:hypothetical protein
VKRPRRSTPPTSKAERERVDDTLARPACHRGQGLRRRLQAAGAASVRGRVRRSSLGAAGREEVLDRQDKDKRQGRPGRSGIEAVEKFVAEINAKVTKLTARPAPRTSKATTTGGEKSYLDNRSTAGAEVDRRAKELQSKDSKLDYTAATDRVLAARCRAEGRLHRPLVKAA